MILRVPICPSLHLPSSRCCHPPTGWSHCFGVGNATWTTSCSPPLAWCGHAVRPPPLCCSRCPHRRGRAPRVGAVARTWHPVRSPARVRRWWRAAATAPRRRASVAAQCSGVPAAAASRGGGDCERLRRRRRRKHRCALAATAGGAWQQSLPAPRPTASAMHRPNRQVGSGRDARRCRRWRPTRHCRRRPPERRWRGHDWAGGQIERCAVSAAAGVARGGAGGGNDWRRLRSEQRRHVAKRGAMCRRARLQRRRQRPLWRR